MSSDFLDRISKLSPKRLALLALEQHEKLQARGGPIAIVGLGCRFPGGADDPDAFWELLAEGRDAVREVPAQRWDIDTWYDPDPDAPARMSVRNGGFLDRIDGFDAAFFGISPREALTMDPQQRLVLEVTWEALEHAGIAPSRLAGSATGVFVGVCNSDHFQRSIDRGTESIDAYLASGNAHSVISGRIAYFLGLHGPALSIDTACSSSLVALHVAVQSLRAGEVRVALAGGVNVMCSPQTTIALTKAHMLAPDGRCKTFDAAADGFARGEGCGMLVLKRLSDAQADGDRVLALIRGSASNQDGRSGGLTVPSGPAQEAVIRAALVDAQLQPADIGYVEAHGTGTTLGDPIEVRALGAALSPGRPADAPLLIGSVKTNMGHLESAAGVAGVIKVVLSLLHGQIPPHLHFKQPSSHIDWQRYPVQVRAEGCTWARSAVPRRAGISSFGFSGTNAHLVLEEAPAQGAADVRDADGTAASGGVAIARPLHVLPLSARSPTALQLLAERFVHRLEGADAAEFAAVAHSAGIGRSHFAERLAVVAADAQEARAALRAFMQGEAHEALHVGTSQPGQATEFAFMFTGQGSQYPGMGMRLGALAPAFAEVIDRCDRLLGADAKGRTLKDVLQAPAGHEPGRGAIHETAWTQPALFALELALTEQWRRWGVPPAAVIGHSVGEYPAACAAGVFTLEHGLALIAERGRLMQVLPGKGAMASLNVPAAEVERAVAATAGRVSIAAVNAPDNLVVAGEVDAVDALLAHMAARDVVGQKLHVALAAHSPLVEPALAGLEAAAGRVPMKPPTLPVAWNVGGGTLPATERTQAGAPRARYWCRQLREPVLFAEGLAWLHDQGFSHFIEVGPHPALAALAERCLPEGRVHCIGSLRRGREDWTELMHALARAYVLGAAVNWAEVDRPFAAARTGLPTYPFERLSFWIETMPPTRQSPDTADASAETDAPLAAPRHPMTARRLPTAVPTFELHLRPDAPDWLGEHRVMGEPLVAGPVFVELIAATARALWGAPPLALMRLEVHAPLVLPHEGRVVQWHFTPAGNEGEHQFAIHSRAVTSPAVTVAHDWTCHATGQVRMPAATAGPGGDAVRAPIALAQLAKDLGAPASCAPYYERLRGLGIDLGPVFASLQQAHRRDGTVLARLQLADSALADPVTLAHPGLLDGALQAVGMALPAAASGAPGAAGATVYLLSGVQELMLHRCPLPPTLWCLASLRASDSAEPAEPAQWQADVTLHDDSGACVGRICGVTLRRAAVESLQRIVAGANARPAADGPALPQAADVPASLAYEVTWEPCVAMSRAARLLAAPSVDAAALRGRFEAHAADHGLSVYDALLPELDDISAAYVAQALGQLGFDSRPGRRFAVDAEARALGVAAPQRKLFARMLQMLAEDGVLVADGKGPDATWECPRALPTPPAGQLAARQEALAARFAPVDGELSTLRLCGPQLARVLRGEQDPLQLLFPGGSFAEAKKLYVESPYARTYNGALAAALRAAVGRLPEHARLRVLEIGAGTGGTTTYVLPVLPAERTEYVFTDLSPLFLERAAEQFSAFPFVQHRLLDIERDPVTQGFANAHYDIVIAANVLHASTDLGQALAHARALLAPGGQLLLLEGTAPVRWVDLTFGLTEGWWRFTDNSLRPDYALISRDAWRGLLARKGFDEIGLFPEDGATARANTARRAQDQQVLIVARAAAPPRRWQLVGGPPALAAALEHKLLARGDRVARLASLACDEPGDDAASADSADGAVEWVYLGALELATLPPDAKDGPARCENLAVQQPLRGLARLARRPAASPPARAWLVTQGAQRLPGDDAAPSGRWTAPLAGLGRVFALEQPARWGGLVDLPAGAEVPSLVEWLLRSFDCDDDEDQLAWRGGRRHVARLVAAPPAAAAAAHALPQVPALRADATYLVTGGFGGLGGPVAQWLVEQGARHIALLGRRPDAEAPLVRTLRERGAQVVLLAGDVGDEAFVATLPRRLAEADAPALAGIFHLAADLSHAAIGSLNEAQVGAMLRPKIGGTLALERLARAQQLDWLVLFSTTTALLGAAGLAHYAAANTFLDATAESAAGERPKIVAINWGTWEAMRLASASDQQDFREAGLLPMRTADALEAMARLLRSGRSRGVIAKADWKQLKAVHEARRARPLLRRLGGEPAPSAALPSPAATGRNAAAAAAHTLARRLGAVPPGARHDVLVDFVQREVAAVLALPDSGAIALGAGLFDMGMDSLMAVELKRRLERAAGQPLPSTLTFNYSNVGALVGFLSRLLAPVGTGGASVAAAAVPASRSANGAQDTAGTGPAELGADLGDLSEDELEARLLAALETTR